MIDFVEPADLSTKLGAGKYKREVFEIKPEDEQNLRETLNQVAQEVISGEFLNKACGLPDCPGCKLWRMMK